MKLSLRKALLLFTLFIIIIPGAITYIHAYHFTHFSSAAEARTDPKKLTIADRFSLLFTGIKNPHQADTLLPAVPYQTFIIQSDLRLESWYIPADRAKGLILLYHGYAGSKSSMIDRAMDLRSMGYATALISFRGSGNSEGNYTTIGYEEGNDVVASYHFYQKKFPGQPVFLYGSSMGAAAILKAMDSESLDVNGILLEYPFATLHQSVKNRFKVMGYPQFPLATLLTFFGGAQLGFNAFAHNPADYATKVNCPALHMAGDHDDRVTNEETAALFKNLNTTDKTLFIFKGGGHESFNKNFSTQWTKLCHDFLEQHY